MSTHNSTYDSIAKDYHLKRKQPWKDFESFINYLIIKKYNFFGCAIDLGCASGRNFKIISNFSEKIIGIDNSIEFLKIAHQNVKDVEFLSGTLKMEPQLILADICYLPIRLKTLDLAFSIAAIHHIRTKLERNEVMNQIYNILKPGGYCCITLWRKFQKRFRYYFIGDWIRRLFYYRYKTKQKQKGLDSFGDKFIPWKVSSNKKTYYRFYHFFSRQEAKNLIKKFKLKEFKKLGGPNKKDNFFILVQNKNKN